MRALAKRYGINQKTVEKWKRRPRTDLTDRAEGSRSTVLSLEEEAIVFAFRKHTLLPLDDCLYALQPSLPHLTRSSLHRCLQRHRHFAAAPPTSVAGRASRSRPLDGCVLDGAVHCARADLRVTAYNFARRLKTLKGLTPYEYVRKLWTKEPYRFTLNPSSKCRD